MDTFTPQAFRKAFPAFMDPGCYPEHSIEFWAGFGEKMMNKCRWGNLLPEGLCLYVAHQLTIEFNSTRAARKGQAPGQISGAVTSASVDKVSYSRDASSAMEPNAGHWNLSTYGLRYRQIMLMVGAGAVHLPEAGTGPVMGGAWPGVIYPMQG